MPKFLPRLVALILVPCLAVDPIMVMGSIGPVGAGFHPRPQSESDSIPSIQFAGRRGDLPLQFPFTSQALELPIESEAVIKCEVAELRRQDELPIPHLPAAPAQTLLPLLRFIIDPSYLKNLVDAARTDPEAAQISQRLYEEAAAGYAPIANEFEALIAKESVSASEFREIYGRLDSFQEEVAIAGNALTSRVSQHARHSLRAFLINEIRNDLASAGIKEDFLDIGTDIPGETLVVSLRKIHQRILAALEAQRLAANSVTIDDHTTYSTQFSYLPAASAAPVEVKGPIATAGVALVFNLPPSRFHEASFLQPDGLKLMFFVILIASVSAVIIYWPLSYQRERLRERLNDAYDRALPNFVRRAAAALGISEEAAYAKIQGDGIRRWDKIDAVTAYPAMLGAVGSFIAGVGASGLLAALVFGGISHMGLWITGTTVSVGMIVVGAAFLLMHRRTSHALAELKGAA